ncbi:hypothetical protein EX895_004044 [Sporisorium graminicola]|uniref:Uncharacterized protein n=1 Tax=Sporisorium graminicola TaxID=280036 RepID=A0A4U7KTJ0_9BASI|nr:hypothetical protein EX895_004044 [Sporisorium graminicola]TKY87367.1 hypothetical protein EX895_004044 [Sporisorium graminicola]
MTTPLRTTETYFSNTLHKAELEDPTEAVKTLNKMAANNLKHNIHPCTVAITEEDATQDDAYDVEILAILFLEAVDLDTGFIDTFLVEKLRDDIKTKQSGFRMQGYGSVYWVME